MDILEAINTRHSVRSYTDQKIDGEVLDKMQQAVAECNIDGDLHIQLCVDEPTAFSGRMAR